jgi:hypothetical protein
MTKAKPVKKINKSAWIRKQPKSLAAKEVVERAKKEGFALTLAQVYTARSAASRAGGAPIGKPGRKPGSTKAALVLTDLQREFVQLAVRIGTDEAARLLDAAANDRVDLSKPSAAARPAVKVQKPAKAVINGVAAVGQA